MKLILIALLGTLISANTVANSNLRNSLNFAGDYDLVFGESSPNCPSTARIQKHESVFYADLLPRETRYQIIGSNIYPRTEEKYKVGYYASPVKYVQKRFRKDSTGNYNYQIMEFTARVDGKGKLFASLFTAPDRGADFQTEL
ncbi:MAG: hypothetical protein NXH75_14975, partial [Halobacteriovoraceae bacterium]|nr:hypothetical protein [Halobacteriovoraceae bacterium]